MSKEVIVALDFSSVEKVVEFLNPFHHPIYVKVGMELYYSEGPKIIETIKAMGHKVFLDLKVHDIPNTAFKAMQALSKLDVDIVNVHCAGGSAMLQKAKEAFEGKKTLVIGVTQLTSISQEALEKELCIHEDLEKVVLNYARLAKEAGLDGVVCSALEASRIHKELGDDFLTVCPGIRNVETKDDQVRVCTPQKANQLTCDYIVVGRPITQAESSFAMYEKMSQEFKTGEIQ